MIDKKLLARIEAAAIAVIDAVAEADRLTSGAYQALADALAEAFGKDWFTLETKPNKTAEEKERVKGLREVRKGFTAQAKQRGINSTAAWQNVKRKHQPAKKKDAGSTAPRMLETFTLESIPPALRRAAKDDDLDTPDYVLAFWSDVEAAFIKRFPKMTRTKIHGEG